MYYSKRGPYPGLFLKMDNDDALSEIRRRDYLYRKALRSRHELDWILYRSTRNRVVKVIGDAKREFVENVIN